MTSSRTTCRMTIAMIALLANVTLTGCDPESSPPPTSPVSGVVPLICERSYSDLLANPPVIHTERFARDAAGRHSLTLLTLDGKEVFEIVEPAAQQNFARLQAWFQTGLGNFIANRRDFSVGDPALFATNYGWNLLTEGVTIAGRLTNLFDVRPVFADRPSYLVWADVEHHVPLRLREFTPAGVLASEMEVTSVEFDPDLTNEAFADLSFVDQQPAATPTEVAAWANFEVFQPAYLPAGFIEESVRIGSMSGFPFAVHTWTDGVVRLMLTQYAQLQDPAIVPPIPAPEGVFTMVRIERHGPTYDASFALEGTQLHVVAKLKFDEFQTVLESMVGEP